MGDIVEGADAWKAKARSYSGASVEYIKIADGESVNLRILNKVPFPIKVHRIVVKGTGRPATCLEGIDTFGCPACAKGNKYTNKNTVSAIDRRDGKVKLWEFSETLKGQLHAMVLAWKKLPTEFDVVLSRTGKTKDDTRYALVISPEQKPLSEAEQKLETPDLAEYYKPNRERMETLLQGKLPEKKQDQNGTTETQPQAATTPATGKEEPAVNPLEDGGPQDVV